MYSLVVETSRAQKYMERIPQNISIRGNEGMMNWGKLLVRELLKSAKVAGIKQFRSNRSMFTSTRYIQKSSVGVVVMPKSGLYQDRATPHWVSVPGNKPKPLLRSWFQRYWGVPTGSFYFTPRPFIRRGVKNSVSRVAPVMRGYMKRAIRESGLG